MLSALRDRFLAYVPDGGHILDVGCGSGRDTKAFLEQGYTVTAIDASSEMAKIASEWIGQPVLCKRIGAYEPEGQFEGIWASASLLHLPETGLTDVLQRISGWLNEDGVLYVSFKQGEGERTSGGRHFTDMSLETLRDLFLTHMPLSICETWISGDVEGRGIRWVNVISEKE